jgi:hypothetical protein
MLDNLQSQTQEPHYQNSFTKPIIFVLEQNSIEKNSRFSCCWHAKMAATIFTKLDINNEFCSCKLNILVHKY